VLAWIDLEMTGLDPARNVIVEIATIVTDDDLNIVAEGPDLVIGATPEQLAAMDEVVRRMHTTSGLLAAIAKSTVTVEEAAAATLEFLKSQLPTAGSVPLCGNSIAMDRSFLRQYMPVVDDYFHYRTIDVSSVKELCKRWYRDVYGARPQKLTAHRALDDIRESVAELIYYREHVFRTPTEIQALAAVSGEATEQPGGAVEPPEAQAVESS
jgi:oligoribonuclease